MRALIVVIVMTLFFNISYAQKTRVPAVKKTMKERTVTQKQIPAPTIVIQKEEEQAPEEVEAPEEAEEVQVQEEEVPVPEEAEGAEESGGEDSAPVEVAIDPLLLQEAQAWLASINYNVSIEQVPLMTRLTLDMYGSFNGISTQQLISNENLRHLKVLTNLQQITLPTWLNDSGLSNVAGLTNLKVLSLGVTNITDAGMIYLKDLNSLESVSLHGTKITSEGLKHLQGKNLTRLGLNQTNIGDADMELIGSMTSLTSLGLVGTKITDASIPHLKKLTNLQRVDIVGTQITPQGKQELQAANPGLNIY